MSFNDILLIYIYHEDVAVSHSVQLIGNIKAPFLRRFDRRESLTALHLSNGKYNFLELSGGPEKER